jgi:DNA topoisomerase-1
LFPSSPSPTPEAARGETPLHNNPVPRERHSGDGLGQENEAIAYHIATVFSLPVATTKRIVFNEITRPALTAAIGSPTTINQNCVKSQFARQIIDIMIGFKVSPLLWKRIYMSRTNALSAGRDPALKLIYDNYVGRNSAPTLVYKIVGSFLV